LTKAGHVVTSDEPLKGYTRVYIDDPFGNRIELMQPQPGLLGMCAESQTGSKPILA
jgi:hypothetical protein